ncbi:MAG: hypothetical protein HPY66_1275 [Firmicutes bacterium]|nr:hypothetical protein [Bacillota bacterium]
MKIKFFAYIRDYTGSKEIEYNRCATVQELLDELCIKYGIKFRKLIFTDDHQLSDEIIILVNGRSIVHLNFLNTPLKQDDEISIFPVVAGG